MEENKKKFGWGPKMRLTAGVLVFALLLSLGVNAAVGIRISAENAQEAATNYLAENTEYVQSGRWVRVGDKLLNLAEPVTLEEFYRKAGIQIGEADYLGAYHSILKCMELFAGGDKDLQMDLQMKKGCLEVLLNMDEEALISLDEALRLRPEESDAYLVKAQIQTRQGDSGALAQTLTAYLEQKPEDREIRELLAQTMFVLEDYTGAAAQYERLLEELPPEEDPTLNEYLYAMTSIQIGEYATAENYLRRARERDGTLEGVDYYIGMCQMAQENYKDAEASMTAAIEKNSMLQLSQYSRGVCRLMNEQPYETAAADLKQAAGYEGEDVDPNVTEQAQKLLEELAAAEAQVRKDAAMEAGGQKIQITSKAEK